MRFHHRRALLLVPLLAAVLAHAPPAAAVTDSLYAAHHPVLLFTAPDLPALRARVSDGGNDAFAWAFIEYLADSVYAAESDSVFLTTANFGLGDIPNLGLAGYLVDPPDTTRLDRGRRAVLALAADWDVDDNVYYAPLRLRALALGYDLFFTRASPAERDLVVAEMEGYVDSMLTSHAYELWEYRPYLANISTMIASALGLAAICLDGQTDPQRVSAAIAACDHYIDQWLRYLIDPDGACKEGIMYGTWSMRQLSYYFEARRRYDGTDFSQVPAIRNIEKWLAYEMVPTGRGHTNNLGDAATLNFPVARHNAYLDWAQMAWNSGLSRWLWLELADPETVYDWGRLRDVATTVLWNRDIPAQSPEGVLPLHFLWHDRGLYYFRSGWHSGKSNDVVFHFYSGKFHGGHSQEDQNSFTLYAFGQRLAIDHGFTAPDWESEAHNMTFIDGKGQHFSGGTVGTDGRITDALLGETMDLVCGDATAAYTTYSEFNAPGVPFPESDWSYGYDGGNPVRYATRCFVVAHGAQTPPYLVLVEDIRKDDAVHRYDWRMHTDEAHTLHLAQNPLEVETPDGTLQLHFVEPSFDSLTVTESRFDNQHEDPDARVIVASVDAVAPRFFLLMLPVAGVAPVVTSAHYPWGSVATMEWPGGAVDVALANASADTVTLDAAGHTIATDATLALLRFSNGELTHLLRHADILSVDGRSEVEIAGAPLAVTVGGNAVVLDRATATFRIRAPGATEVRSGDTAVVFHREGDYAVSGPGGGTTAPPGGIALRAAPVPFRTRVDIVLTLETPGVVEVTVYDAAGRRVTTLLNESLGSGMHPISWDGSDARGGKVASGVYFVRALSAVGVASRKLVVVR